MNKNIIVIGIDQSYKDTGISVCYNGKIKMAKSIPLEKLKNNTERRYELQKQLHKIMSSVHILKNDYNAEVIVIMERIRLRSQGFINIDYIKSIGALNALIKDTAYDFDYPVYTVDTRAWKSAVVGSSKPKQNPFGIDPNKYPTILWCNRNGYNRHIKQYIGKSKKQLGVMEDGFGKYTYNDNIADSICISLFYFQGNRELLKEEK